MKYIYVRSVLLVCALLARPVRAQEEEGPEGLVPCTGDASDECNFCQVIQLGDNVFGWLISVLTSIFIIILIVNGLRLVTAGGDVSAMKSARSMINNAIIGFIIVLGAWVFVDFLLKVLMNGGENLGPWNELDCGNLENLN